MTSGVKRERLNAIWECLQRSFGGTALKNSCRKALLGRHIEHLEGSPTIITTISVEVGGKDGWISVWQQGGGLTVVIWSINQMSEGAREEVRALRYRLEAVGAMVQIRWARPQEWLARKGWPQIYEGCEA